MLDVTGVSHQFDNSRNFSCLLQKKKYFSCRLTEKHISPAICAISCVMQIVPSREETCVLFAFYFNICIHLLLVLSLGHQNLSSSNHQHAGITFPRIAQRIHSRTNHKSSTCVACPFLCQNSLH